MCIRDSNRMIGPWTQLSTITTPPVGSSPTEVTAHNNYIDQLRATAIDGQARHTEGREKLLETLLLLLKLRVSKVLEI